MPQSIASADQSSVSSHAGTAPALRQSLFERLLYGYLGGASLIALALIAAGGLQMTPSGQINYALVAIVTGGIALVLALAGAVSAWRGKLTLARWLLVAWALALVSGGAVLADSSRTLWFITALLPVICAMLFLPTPATVGTAALSLAAIWLANLLVLPAPTAEQRQTWLILSAGLALVSLLLATGTALLRHMQYRIGKQAQVLATINQKLTAEQERSERSTHQWALERDRLAAVLDAAPDGIALADPNGTILSANTAARQLLNETVGSALEGQKLGAWSRDIPGRVRLVSNDREGDRRRTLFELLAGSANGRIICLLQVPIRSTSGEIIGLVGLFHDQTGEVELEQVRSQFLDLLVQDMHDPLTSILAAQDTLLSSELGDGNERVLTAARRSTTRLLDLVRTLLEMSRLQSDPSTLHRLPHPLRPLLESSVAQATPTAQQRAINLVMEYGSDGGPMMFDSDKMRRVMLSLLDNALKHSPAYSTIRIQANQSNGLAQIRISDQGAGISPEYAQGIFERFGKVAGEQRLGGLGLAFCKLVIEAHGGRIWVESSPGKGSTFAFSLPA
ncbi:MAG: PAS domain-containing protein [Herpetosiphonaceae bacterium]|nr:PAS domain-containing protein [Herpetosiphonaceae bacterium]